MDLPPRELPGADPTADVVEREHLAEALATLPPRMRAVLVLRYAEDLSEAATAEALGCSVHTVKSQTARGLARLRAHPGTTPTPDRSPAFEER